MEDSRKTQPRDADVAGYLATVADERRRADASAAVELIHEVTGAEPVLWGDSMIGFGRQTYTTADGRSHAWFAVGLAARKAALTLYGLTYTTATPICWNGSVRTAQARDVST
ncbi:MAG TPA: hypothetical protein VK020_09185 [Microlunatus sp.]|nr:hypothetical protein [Microlunatus sp.]